MKRIAWGLQGLTLVLHLLNHSQDEKCTPVTVNVHVVCVLLRAMMEVSYVYIAIRCMNVY